MRILRIFPKHFRLVNEKVAEVRLYYAFSPEEEDDLPGDRNNCVDYRYYDFFVTLKDGRGFGFSAYTPEYIRDYLTREVKSAFVDSGLLILREISVDAFLHALEECLEREYLYGLEAFGYRSNRLGDMEKRFRFGMGNRLIDMRITILKRWPVRQKHKKV